MGQSSQKKSQAKRGKKNKFSPKQSRDMGRRKSNESPKNMKMAKFKRWTQIEDIAKHEKQPKWFLTKCNP